MREPRAEQVPFVVQEDLRFVHQAPERRGVHDAAAVPLVVGARGRRGFRVPAPPGLRRVAGIDRQFIDLHEKRHWRFTDKRQKLLIS